MLPGADGLPDPTKVETVATDIGAPVDLRVGPNGDLVYVDIFKGTVERIYAGEAGEPPPQQPTPVAIIDGPVETDTYTVGQPIDFRGRATDADGNALPVDQMRWDLILLHCPTENQCHRHFVESREGVTSGSFVAPDHESPSKLEVGLTVTHNGRTDTTTVVLERGR